MQRNKAQELAQQMFAEETAELQKTKITLRVNVSMIAAYKHTALEQLSCHDLNCDYPTYKKAATMEVKDMFMPEMGIAINALNMISAARLGLSMTEYLRLQDSVEVVGKQWNEVYQAVSQSVRERYEGKPQIFTPNKGILKS